MKRKHLTFEERQTIKNMLDKKESFKSIARELVRDCTTISKEVKWYYIKKKYKLNVNKFNVYFAAFNFLLFLAHLNYSNIIVHNHQVTYNHSDYES